MSPLHWEGDSRLRYSPLSVEAVNGGGLLPTEHVAVSAKIIIEY